MNEEDHEREGEPETTNKEIAIKTIQQLPPDATWEDIQERISFVAGVRRGLRELDESRGISHDKAKRKPDQRLSG